MFMVVYGDGGGGAGGTSNICGAFVLGLFGFPGPVGVVGGAGGVAGPGVSGGGVGVLGGALGPGPVIILPPLTPIYLFITPGISGISSVKSTKSGFMSLRIRNAESARRSPKSAFNMRPLASPNKLTFPADPTYSTPPIMSITSASMVAALNKNQKSCSAYMEKPVSTGTTGVPCGKGANSLYICADASGVILAKKNKDTKSAMPKTIMLFFLLHMNGK